MDSSQIQLNEMHNSRDKSSESEAKSSSSSSDNEAEVETPITTVFQKQMSLSMHQSPKKQIQQSLSVLDQADTDWKIRNSTITPFNSIKQIQTMNVPETP